MFKKFGAVLLSVLMLVGCSSASGSKTDYEEATKNYIELSMKGKWEKAEELAKLDADNPIKWQQTQVKDYSWQLKDLKDKIGEEKYTEFANKVKDAYSAEKIVKKYKIENVKEDKDSNIAVVKVSMTMMNYEKIQDKIEEIMSAADDKGYELQESYLKEDYSNYDEAEKQGMAEAYNDDVLNQILAIYSDAYATQEMKVTFDIEKGKIAYSEVEL